jgi:hypothetical protein
MLTGTYDVFLSRDAASSLGALPRTRIADNVPIHSVAERTLQQIFISNQPNGISDVTTYWDNVSLSVGRVLPSIAGDANLDGIVDITDLGLLATAWQMNANWQGGDFTGDGFVDITDLGLLATNWQQTAGRAGTFAEALQMTFGADAAAALPEPVSLPVLAAAGLLLNRPTRQRRSGSRI